MTVFGQRYTRKRCIVFDFVKRSSMTGIVRTFCAFLNRALAFLEANRR